jgi:cytochrome c oxidase subunit IV
MSAGHEHLGEEAYQAQKKAVWRATGILAVVTVVEVTCALLLQHTLPRPALNLLFILMSAIKAFFIVAEFMHLKYEFRALAISILAPCFFFIWFVIAFMMEGASWLSLRQLWM